MTEESSPRLRALAVFLSVGVHAGILLLGGKVLIHPAEFSLQQNEGSTQVELVAALPREEAVLAAKLPSQAEPQVSEAPKSEDVVQPKPVSQKEKTLSPKPAPHPAAPKPSAAVGDGSSPVPGQDATTSHAGQSGTASAKPDYLRNPVPRYPEAARSSHQEGVVTLMVDVSENGEALDVSVKQTSGYKILDNAAVEAVKGWKFKPGTLAGMPVRSRVEVPVRFRLEQR